MSTAGNVHTTPSATCADQLRASMVAELLENGSAHSDPVAQAFLAVPRDEFAPEVSLEAAYSLDIVRTKVDAGGATLSAVPMATSRTSPDACKHTHQRVRPRE